MDPSFTSCSARVGRMPIMTRLLPTVRALVSAALRSARSSVSSVSSASPASIRGGTLISRLNCPTSVARAGLGVGASAAALRIDGMPCSSVRLSSISWPTVEGLSSNRRSRSMRANASSERRTLSRYLRRSSPLILIAWMSRPTSGSAQRVTTCPVSHLRTPLRGVQPRALVAYPQVQQAAQVRDEHLVLVLGVHRLDRPDQQLVEAGAGHPLQHDLVQAVQAGPPGILFAAGVEVGDGQAAVCWQLLRLPHS